MTDHGSVLIQSEYLPPLQGEGRGGLNISLPFKGRAEAWTGTPSPSRGGMGGVDTRPIPLLTSPLKGEERCQLMGSIRFFS